MMPQVQEGVYKLVIIADRTTVCRSRQKAEVEHKRRKRRLREVAEIDESGK